MGEDGFSLKEDDALLLALAQGIDMEDLFSWTGHDADQGYGLFDILGIGLDESFLLNLPLLYFLHGDVLGNYIIKLTNYVGRLKVELFIELMVVDVLNESEHVDFSGQAGNLAGFLVKSSNIVPQGLIGCLLDAHQLRRYDGEMMLIAESGFKEDQLNSEIIGQRVIGVKFVDVGEEIQFT
ncbi:hypothetical protein ACLOJK_028783 [Asimina triloba]